MVREFNSSGVQEFGSSIVYQDIIEGIKKMFPHKIVEIIVQPADETEYILSNPAYAAELKSRIEDYKTKQEGINLKAEDIL